jgi:hypothetical protein
MWCLGVNLTFYAFLEHVHKLNTDVGAHVCTCVLVFQVRPVVGS